MIARNVTPMPYYTQHLGHLQWSGKYWGEYGALEYARRYQDLVQLTPVGWVSLHYGASGNALARWKQNKLGFWWLLLCVVIFSRAFFKAYELAESIEALTPEECSVVGVVLRRGGLKELSVHVFEHGLSSSDTEAFEIRALLYVELFEVQRMPLEHVTQYIWGLPQLPYMYEQAKSTKQKIIPGQLCRILRKVGLNKFAELLAREAEVDDQVLKARA